MMNNFISNQNNISLNGYRASHRNKWRFIQCGILSLQELSLLEFYADTMGFDKRNPQCGLIAVNFENIAYIFGNSPGAVRLWHKRLLAVGLIKETATRGIFSLTCYERYIGPGKWQGKAVEYADSEKNQPVEIMFQNFEINLQEIKQKIQEVEKKPQINLKISPPIAIDSYNVKSSFIPKQVFISQPIRTNEEYQRIYEEGGYRLLLPDDMRWIDGNLGGKSINANTQTLEEKAIEVFFNNDFELYQRSIL